MVEIKFTRYNKIYVLPEHVTIKCMAETVSHIKLCSFTSGRVKTD